jgi:hypothetical protein
MTSGVPAVPICTAAKWLEAGASSGSDSAPDCVGVGAVDVAGGLLSQAARPIRVHRIAARAIEGMSASQANPKGANIGAVRGGS